VGCQRFVVASPQRTTEYGPSRSSTYSLLLLVHPTEGIQGTAFEVGDMLAELVIRIFSCSILWMQKHSLGQNHKWPI
jgi:hypothetical protein